jgi:hypothetical protein
MKIIAIVTLPSEIWRILSRIGWPTKAPDFEPPIDFADSQLVAGTVDGFLAMEYDYSEGGPDPPSALPQWENDTDPPHWEDSHYVIYD